MCGCLRYPLSSKVIIGGEGGLRVTYCIKKDKATDSDIMNDSYLILVGVIDSYYEVSGTYCTHFIALGMSPWYQRAWDEHKILV